ncbi:MAG: hypothetical protein O2960_07395 [Verrucomicrobia bacterium]|nr:hypothetical protein [Verrucomicrobiota bacterium]
MIHRLAFLSLVSTLLIIATRDVSAAEDRRAKVLNDRTEVEAMSEWIYNDLPKATADAGRTGKPLLVVIRCIP